MNIKHKDSYWFPHDSNARNDIKILNVRRDHGAAGIGIYWMLIEMLRDQNDYRLSVNSLLAIAYDLHVDEKIIKAIIYDYDLFKIDGEAFYSDRLSRTMSAYNDKKTKLVEAGKRGAEARYKPGHGHPIAIRLDKIRLNKIREDESILNAPFEKFWDLYDKKVDKGLALKQWRALTDEERLLAMAYLPKYKLSNEKKFRRDPEKFLRTKYFNNEIIEPSNEKNRTPVGEDRDSAIRNW